MKLENKLILPFVVFLISILVLSVFLFNFIELTKKNYRNIVNSDSRFNNAINVLIYYNVVKDASFSTYFKTGQQEYLDRYNKYVQKSRELYDELAEDLSNPVFRENYQEQAELFRKITDMERQALTGMAGADILSGEEYLTLKKNFSEKMDLPKEFYNVHVKEEMVKNVENARRNELMIFSVLLLTVVLIVFEFIVVKRDVINPMKQIDKLSEDKRNFENMAKLAMVVMKDKQASRQEMDSMKNMVKLAAVVLKDSQKKK